MLSARISVYFKIKAGLTFNKTNKTPCNQSVYCIYQRA